MHLLAMHFRQYMRIFPLNKLKQDVGRIAIFPAVILTLLLVLKALFSTRNHSIVVGLKTGVSQNPVTPEIVDSTPKQSSTNRVSPPLWEYSTRSIQKEPPRPLPRVDR